MAGSTDGEELSHDAFDSPEEAAMAGWQNTPHARARVVGVRRRTADEVVVIIQLDGGVPGFHAREACVCVRNPNGTWSENGSTGL
jgi:hypothetical protein